MSPDNYYYTTDGKSALGPVTLPEIKRMLRTGELIGPVQVAREGTQVWHPLDDGLRLPNVVPVSVASGTVKSGTRDVKPLPPEKDAAVAGNASHCDMFSARTVHVLLCLLLLVSTIGVGTYVMKTYGSKPPKTSPALVKWDYNKISFPAANPKYPSLGNPGRNESDGMVATTVVLDEEELDRLGKEGWELVASYLEIQTAFPNFGKEEYVTGLRENIRPQLLVCIFKRPHYE